MSRPSFLLLAACLAAFAGAVPVQAQAQAQEAAAPPLPPGEKRDAIQASRQKELAESLALRTRLLPKLPAGATATLDLPYVDRPAEGTVPGSGQTLDLYVPSGAGPFPLIVFIHGGAWKGGDKGGRGAEVAVSFVPEGFAVASVDYRLVFDASFPGMFQDAIDAVAFLRDHAGEYRLDAARVGVFGESAGGNIAGVVAMAEGAAGGVYARTGPPVQAAALWCGFYDMTKETGQCVPGQYIGCFTSNPRDDFAYLYPTREYNPEMAKQMSPIYLIHPGIPPVLLVRGDQDTVAPLVQSEMFAAALQKAGAEVAFTHYPAYGHGLWRPDVVPETLAFFKRHLQGQGQGR